MSAKEMFHRRKQWNQPDQRYLEIANTQPLWTYRSSNFVWFNLIALLESCQGFRDSKPAWGVGHVGKIRNDRASREGKRHLAESTYSSPLSVLHSFCALLFETSFTSRFGWTLSTLPHPPPDKGLWKGRVLKSK